MGRLTGIDTVLLLDLDGTLYVGSQVVPGAGAEPDAVVDSVADLPGLLQG